MKKPASVLAVLLAAATVAVAQPSGNTQKIYPIDSEIYQSISMLYVAQGRALPSTTGPWSADELLGMMDTIDRDSLPESWKKIYDDALGGLAEKTGPFRFGLSATAEAYLHTNTTDFTADTDWVRGITKRKPFLSIELETWPGEHFYGFSSLDVMNCRYTGWGADGAESTLWGSSALTTNLPVVPPAALQDLDFGMPYRAIGAFGGKGWSAEFGREQLSWGPGMTGNFVIGDHIRYQNVGRFTTYGKNFKYTLLTSFFPHPKNYYPVMDPSTGDIINSGWQGAVDSGLSMFLGHRLEWRLFGDRVSFALTEAIMYMSADNTLDLRVLSPTAIFHDYYIRSNANSIISGELSVTPVKGLNLYGQVVVDEFALPGEPVPGRDAAAHPDGFGFMAGAKGSMPLGKGILYGQAEWARTDPYLYLRDNGDYSPNLGEYGLDWVVALREYYAGGHIAYTEDFLGYRYGGDAIVVAGKVGYRSLGAWKAEAKAMYMAHGTHDKWTLWRTLPAGENETTPTTTHETGNNGDLDASGRDAVAHTFVAGLSGSYRILKNLEVFAEADFIGITNPGNIAANPAVSDFQVTAGVTFSL